MLDTELQLPLEIDVLAARSGGLKPREVGSWGNSSEEAFSFLEGFSNELDDWPGDYSGSYEEYSLGLARSRLDDVDRSTLPPKWKEVVRDVLTYAVFARRS